MKSVVCIAVLLLLAGEIDPGSTQLAGCSAAVTRPQLALDSWSTSCTLVFKIFIRSSINHVACKAIGLGGVQYRNSD